MPTSSPRAQAEIRTVHRAVDWAGRTLELSDKEVGGALGASARSVARWREKRHRPTDRHVLAAERLLEVARALDIVFDGDLRRMQEWLHEPLPALRRSTPLRAILNGKLEEVLTVLANVDSGAFA